MSFNIVQPLVKSVGVAEGIEPDGSRSWMSTEDCQRGEGGYGDVREDVYQRCHPDSVWEREGTTLEGHRRWSESQFRCPRDCRWFRDTVGSR